MNCPFSIVKEFSIAVTHSFKFTVFCRTMQSYGGQFSVYRVKCMKTFAEFPFFHGECINLTISRQQLQLLYNYSSFFRKAVVSICTCKGDFLRRAALSEYL